MNTPNISQSSKGTTSTVLSIFCCRRMSDIPDASGFSKGGVWGTSDISGFRETESYDRHNVYGSRTGEVLERQCGYTDPRNTTAEGTRHTSETSQQPSAYGDQTCNMKKMFEMIEEMYNKKMEEMSERIEEMYNKKMKETFAMMKEMNKDTKEIFENMKKMENKIITFSDAVHTLVHCLDSHNRARLERVTQTLPITNKEEENEMLKEKIKILEKRISDFLAKAMAMHQHSEDINDPSHLSAVLKRYEILRLQEWEKVRNSCHWTYDKGSHIIKKLFDACEKDIQQRRNDILKVLDISPSNLTKVMMQGIMKLLRQHYHQNSVVYYKIVQEAAITIRTQNATQFLLECCQIYCLLLLQDPPVKAEWEMNKMHLEHVDKKDARLWEETSLLWPIMKSGEEIVVKGVVWDQRKCFESQANY